MSTVRTVPVRVNQELVAVLESLLADAKSGKAVAMAACFDYGTKYRTVFEGSSTLAEEVGMMQMAIWDRLKPEDA